MENQLSSLGLVGQRIEGLTAEDISEADRDIYCRRGKSRARRVNELARTLSHERTWKAIFAAGHSHAVILEDDAFLDVIFPYAIAVLVNEPFQLVRLEADGRPCTSPAGLPGYLLTARAARALLGNPRLRWLPIEVAVNRPFQTPWWHFGGAKRARTDFPHEYARRHPIRFWIGRIAYGAFTIARRVFDHLMQLPRGIRSKRIRFRFRKD